MPRKSIIIGWPETSKAIIEHALIADTIKIWITFSEAMKICSDPIHNPTVFDIIPTNDLWSILFDNIATEISESKWLDEYTIEILVENVAELPTEITVSFENPSNLLMSFYGKQWNPFSKIYSKNINV